MAVETAEGPLSQLGKKGYPSKPRLVSEKASRLEVWTKFIMFLVKNVQCFCSSLCYCYSNEKGLLITYIEGKRGYFLFYFFIFMTECKVDL